VAPDAEDLFRTEIGQHKEVTMRPVLLLILALTGLAGCVHTETVKAPPSSATVVTPGSGSTSTTVVRP